MICAYCNTEQKEKTTTFKGELCLLTLTCGHVCRRNPNVWLPLTWKEHEEYDPNFGTVIKRKHVTSIDRRELLPLEEEVEETATVDPDILQPENEPHPSEEELVVEIPLKAKRGQH